MVSKRLSTGLNLTHAVNVVKMCAHYDTLAKLLYATDCIFFFKTSLSSGNQQKDNMDKAGNVKVLGY